MYKFNPWVIGIVFLVGFTILAMNHFEVRSPLMGETAQTKGQIEDIKIGFGIKGHGYIQYLIFSYKVDGKSYKGTKKIGRKYGWQKIGNYVVIEYQINKPEKHKLIRCINR